ncbi:helix-turn-helix domain-containing protein [Aeromicrobium sp. Root495]|uniref:helix-turn-helix domain-containing protein n=1 Tax=Aeromicrobium sp. Root495 TaxID=1736550 RepID=UPI003FA4595F
MLVDAGADGATIDDLAEQSSFDATALAQQLSVLRRHGAVTARRSGDEVRYDVAHPRIGELLAVAKAFLHDTTGRAHPAGRPQLRAVPHPDH